jgi:hypothetical protein
MLLRRHMSHGNVREMRGECTKAALAMKGATPKRCKLCESQQHYRYFVDCRLGFGGLSASAAGQEEEEEEEEEAAAALSEQKRDTFWANRAEMDETEPIISGFSGLFMGSIERSI